MTRHHSSKVHEQAECPQNENNAEPLDRRGFMARSAATAGGIVAAASAGLLAGSTAAGPLLQAGGGAAAEAAAQAKSIIGTYGAWASQLAPSPARLSWLQPERTDLTTWRIEARAKTLECLAPPELSMVAEQTGEQTADDHRAAIAPVVKRQSTHDGLLFEEIEWSMPCGSATHAVVLKPADAKGPLPGILALHDHGGKKYFGWRKIVDLPGQNHPLMLQHRQKYYEGRAWANEFARRGYVVLVHDGFAFGSRRVMYGDMSEIPWGGSSTRGKSDESTELEENIATYNAWAAEHEDVMSKSLLCAGTTWPGVVLSEDRRALDVLAARDDVDPRRLACAGLSGGGLRTVYLAGMDDRIRCANCVGFMSSWRDFLLNKSCSQLVRAMAEGVSVE